MELSFNELITTISDSKVYMMIGNGSKNQYGDLRQIRSVIRNISNMIPKNSALLYFGDYPNKDKPDVGYLFSMLTTLRKDINVYMIQIREAKSWGYPKFVKGVYWHNDYSKKCKWGGVVDGKPCSNTKKWLNVHKRVKGTGIECVFVVGGGPITIDEAKLAMSEGIPIQYFRVLRKYAGDGKTRVPRDASPLELYGTIDHLFHSH